MSFAVHCDRVQEDHPIMSFVLNDSGQLALINVATQVSDRYQFQLDVRLGVMLPRALSSRPRTYRKTRPWTWDESQGLGTKSKAKDFIIKAKATAFCFFTPGTLRTRTSR